MPIRPLKGVEVPIPIVVVAIVILPTLIKLANVEEAEADKPPKLEKPVTESPPANVEVAAVEEALRAWNCSNPEMFTPEAKVELAEAARLVKEESPLTEREEEAERAPPR